MKMDQKNIQGTCVLQKETADDDDDDGGGMCD